MEEINHAWDHVLNDIRKRIIDIETEKLGRLREWLEEKIEAESDDIPKYCYEECLDKLKNL